MTHKGIPQIQRSFFIENRDQFTLTEETLSGWLLLCLQAGAFSYSVNEGHWIHCTPGDLALIRPGQTIQRTITQTADFHALYFTWTSREPSRLEGRHTPQDIPRYLSTLSHWRHPVQQCPPEIVSQRANTLLYDLLQQLEYESHLPKVNEQSPVDKSVLQIAERLRREQETPENLAVLAKRNGISPSQLSRRFHAVFGVTPVAYRTQYKIQQACRYLTNTQWTLEQIADQCGFANAFYFSRVFSRHMQCSPSAYRKSHSI